MADYCGGCNARWLLNGQEVTSQCEGEHYRTSNMPQDYLDHLLDGKYCSFKKQAQIHTE